VLERVGGSAAGQDAKADETAEEKDGEGQQAVIAEIGHDLPAKYKVLAPEFALRMDGARSAGKRRLARGAAALLLGVIAAPGWVSAVAQDADAPNLQSIEAAIQKARSTKAPVPVLVRGIVILNRDGLVIEDRTAATEVLATVPMPTTLGDEVEVTGEMTLAQHPRIEKGRLRRLWNGSMPLPLAITPDEAAEGENELFLVQTDAKLLSAEPAGLTGVRLHLTGGHQNFSAVLPGDGAAEDLPPKLLQAGSTIRVTGVLFVGNGLTGEFGDSFTLRLRTPDDIELVEGPSWWTREHLLLLLGLAAIVALIGFQIYARSRHARYRAVAEERANISRDIHDTLAQGFAGITLQLQAAEQMLERDPQRARAYLEEALHLVRHSRNESHLSIEILRSSARNDRLDALIARCIAQMKPAGGAVIEQQIDGDPVPLSYNLLNHCFRIVQEALANAVRHAQASRILVRVTYEPQQLRLEVEDNGRGFDPNRIPGPDQGSFGLTGMRERAASIHSRFHLESGARGTLIRVMVTL
jgi:signal transduction histidine kinase